MIREINWKYEIGQRLIDYKEDGSIKRDITIIDRKVIRKTEINYINNNTFTANKKYYKYLCNLCGFDCNKHYSTRSKKYKEEHWILEYDLFAKIGCSCCCSNPRVVVEHINSIYKTDKWMIPFIDDIEFCKTHTHSCSNKIYPICPNCKEKQSKLISIDKIYINKGISCQYCSDNIKYPNKFMANVLKQLDINFEREYTPDWIGSKFYDFYVPSMNLIIEMDGGLGHGKEIHKLSKQTREESKAIDNYKDEQAKLHGIEVIRIDCDYGNYLNKRFEYIKTNIQYSKLSRLFDLNNINWIKCDTYGCNSLIKIACDIKKENPNITTSEACKILDIKSLTTMSSWWKIGNKYNWCHYDTNEEKHRSSQKLNKNGQLIEVFKNNISLGIFPSILELGRKSEILFGVKLIPKCINESIKLNRPYKEYTFMKIGR